MARPEQKCRGDKGKYPTSLKKRMNRLQRRAAKKNPEIPASYRRYNGYSL